MNTLQRTLKEAFETVFKELQGDSFSPELTLATREEFGHYQCNEALKLAKRLGKSPKEIASQVALALSASPLLGQVEVKGPGFINLWISKSHLLAGLQQAYASERLSIDTLSQKKVIVDFSSPNTAKEMHVGHLRSTIIGDALSRVLSFLGCDVLRLNHIGDWGTSFGMLIAYIKKNQLLKAETTLTDLVGWYRQSKKEFDESPEFKRKAQSEVVLLQGGDPEALQAWQVICDISRKAYQEIYDLLDVQLEERGESYYNPYLKEVVADFESKGLVTLSEGAKCVFLPGFQNREGEPLPLIIQKSDGGYNYASTDLAALRHRIEQEKAERIIYVTDAGQETHFQMIFQAGQLAGYLNPELVTVNHVPFGLVLGPDGKKFKTRSGDTERLIDLLNAGIEHALNIVKERHPEMAEKEAHLLAKTLAIGAIKYADLSCNRQGDYVFSYERMLRFEGNTAIFLLYAYVRSLSIQRKSGKAALPEQISLSHPTEEALALKLLQFPDVLSAVAKELLPNRLTDYLYALAEKFHAFFRDCRVEGTPEEEGRLALTALVSRTLKLGLNLLGVQTVERM
jgi:arginyl-tRNA synthetase